MPFSCTQQAELKKHRPNYFLRYKRASPSFIVRTTRETRTLIYTQALAIISSCFHSYLRLEYLAYSLFSATLIPAHLLQRHHRHTTVSSVVLYSLFIWVNVHPWWRTGRINCSDWFQFIVVLLQLVSQCCSCLLFLFSSDVWVNYEALSQRLVQKHIWACLCSLTGLSCWVPPVFCFQSHISLFSLFCPLFLSILLFKACQSNQSGSVLWGGCRQMCFAMWSMSLISERLPLCLCVCVCVSVCVFDLFRECC